MTSEEKQCCRICAQKCNALISMFGEEGLFRQLMLKLRFCLQIIVLESDDLPTAICRKCAAKLEVCFELMQERIRGQNVFQRKIFTQQVPVNWKHTEVKMEYSHEKELTVTEQTEEQVCDAHQDFASVSESQPDHSKQCHCERCVSHYGGLSLLAEVVDKNKAVSDAACSGSSHITSDETKGGYLEATAASKQETTEQETQTHQPRKVISCEFCGKVFSHTGDLNKHRRRHTGERPYPCPECDKRFSHASNLLRHQKIHSGETPHQCPTCARRFSRKDKMVNHIKKSRCKPNPETHSSV